MNPRMMCRDLDGVKVGVSQLVAVAWSSRASEIVRYISSQHAVDYDALIALIYYQPFHQPSNYLFCQSDREPTLRLRIDND